MADKIEYITIDQLAPIIHMSQQTIRNRISRGLPMPPSGVLPGGKKRLWRKHEVLDWMEKSMSSLSGKADLVSDFYTKNDAWKPVRRGRPKKEETVSRRRKGG